jgi:hypothetical protein
MILEMAFLFVHKSQSPFEGLHFTHGIIMLIHVLNFCIFDTQFTIDTFNFES